MKLADRTEKYLTILGGVRSDYLHFVETLPPDQMSMFSRHLEQFEKELPLKRKRDEFLDVYSAWLRGYRDPVLRQRLTRLVEELQKEDPAFLPPKIVSELTLE